MVLVVALLFFVLFLASALVDSKKNNDNESNNGRNLAVPPPPPPAGEDMIFRLLPNDRICSLIICIIRVFVCATRGMQSKVDEASQPQKQLSLRSCQTECVAWISMSMSMSIWMSTSMFFIVNDYQRQDLKKKKKNNNNNKNGDCFKITNS